jgi:hypothetical protein
MRQLKRSLPFSLNSASCNFPGTALLYSCRVASSNRNRNTRFLQKRLALSARLYGIGLSKRRGNMRLQASLLFLALMGLPSASRADSISDLIEQGHYKRAEAALRPQLEQNPNIPSQTI